MFRERITRVRRWMANVVAPSATEPCGGPPRPQTAGEQRRPGRPVSDALSRATGLVSQHPDITPAELACRLAVDRSYARTLLRRARARMAEGEASLAAPTATPVPIGEFDPAVITGLTERLSAAEDEIRQFRAARPATSLPGIRTSWDLNRRAEVLRRSMAGQSAGAIAADLRIPSGEVAFILRIQEILTAVN